MAQMQRLEIAGVVIGAVVRRPLRNDCGELFGREYVVYAAPEHRNEMLMDEVVADLAARGVVEDTDDVWNQTLIYWGVPFARRDAEAAKR